MQGKKVGVTFYYKPSRPMGRLNWCLKLDLMRYKLDRLKRGCALVLTLTGLLTPPLQAEPLINGSAQPANRLIDASQWVPEAQDRPLNASNPPTATVSIQSAQSSRPLNETPSAMTPSAAGLDKSSTATSAATTRAAPTPAATTKAVDDTLGREIRDSVKEAVRPLHQDLVNSEAAQTLRALQSELSLGKEQAFNDAEHAPTSGSKNTGLPSEAAAWEGQANREPPRTAAQVERDKVLASVMMDKLIDEVTPWAIGLVALYLLGYLVKFALAYGRHRSNRRRQRSLRRSRRNASV